MRLPRSLGVVVAVVSIAVAGSAGAAGAAPTAPYDAFTINGHWSYSFDAGNAAIGLLMRGSEGFEIDATQPGGNNFAARVAAPAGGHLGVGTFATTRTGDATHYGLDVSGNGQGCTDATGSVTVYSITRDPSTGDITSLAASYRQDCFAASGELRWKSSRGYAEAVQDTRSLTFDTVLQGDTSAPQTVTFTSTGSDALKLGAATATGADADMFGVTASTCAGATLTYGQSCTVTVVAHPTAAGAHTATLTVADNSSAGARQVLLSTTGGRADVKGEFFPLTPARILDTRSSNGVATPPLGPGGTRDLQVAGRGSVPAVGVAAVVLNVTVTEPTTGGFVSVYPAGSPRPTASSINFPAGWTGANSVTVPVSADGRITFYNHAGNTHVIADISGYYANEQLTTSAGGGLYHPVDPARVLDTRAAGSPGPLGAGSKVTVPVDLGPGVNGHVRAFALNITAVAPQASGFLTAWWGFGAAPNASTLNFTKNATVPNFAVVPTLLCSTVVTGCAALPSVTILNTGGGSVHVVVDIVGFYDEAQLAGGLKFTPIGPTRITDTREGLGAPHRLGPNSVTTVTAPSAVAGPDTVALSMNVTGIGPDGYTFLSLWPAGGPKPTASTLNLTPHEIRANAAAIGLNAAHQFSVYNQSQTVDLVIDVAGRFDAPPSWAPGSFTARAGPPVRQEASPLR